MIWAAGGSCLYSFPDSTRMLKLIPYCSGLVFVTVSHWVTEAGLELAKQSRLPLNSRSSFLRLTCARITSMCHHNIMALDQHL